MYTLETKNYGLKITFSGFIKVAEMAAWVKESEALVPKLPPKFGVLVDMRSLKPLPADTEAEMQKGQKFYKSKGMERSAVILDSVITTMQFNRIAKTTGIYAFERYINAATVANWEEVAVAWIKDGKDPDKK